MQIPPLRLLNSTPQDKVIVYHGEFLGTALMGDGRFVTTEEPYAAKNSALLCNLYTEQCKRWDVRYSLYVSPFFQMDCTQSPIYFSILFLFLHLSLHDITWLIPLHLLLVDLQRNCVFYNHKVLGGSGTVAKSICETAEKHGVDTVYVGSRGLNAASRLFLGSVSAATTHRCDCNVTVVKDKLAASLMSASTTVNAPPIETPLPIV